MAAIKPLLARAISTAAVADAVVESCNNSWFGASTTSAEENEKTNKKEGKKRNVCVLGEQWKRCKRCGKVATVRV